MVRSAEYPQSSWLVRLLFQAPFWEAEMARTGRPKQLLVLDASERELLERLARRPRTEQRLAVRSRIVLRCADGLDNIAVAAEVGVDPTTVGKWRRRFLAERLEGLSDAPRPGVPRRSR